MDPATYNSLVAQVHSWNAGAYALLIVLVGWLARMLYKARTDTEGSLANSVTALATAVTKLTDVVNANALTQARHDTELDEHRRELDGIWKGENCLNAGCPLRPTA